MKPAGYEQPSDGSASKAFDKSMDKPEKTYTSNESTPADPFCEAPLSGPFENSGDFSKKFA